MITLKTKSGIESVEELFILDLNDPKNEAFKTHEILIPRIPFTKRYAIAGFKEKGSVKNICQSDDLELLKTLLSDIWENRETGLDVSYFGD